jgi:putative transcriptional regulator
MSDGRKDIRGEIGLIATGAPIEDTTLAALASGRLDPALALFLESAMERRGLGDLSGDALAGAALESETPAAVCDDALARVLARIDAGEGAIRPRKSVRLDPDVIRLPKALQASVREAERVRGWSGPLPGIRSLALDLPGSVKAEILRIEAGASTPRHTHGGREYTLCLLGGFSDGRGSYGPGDIATADDSVEHQPRADADGPCYVLAITDADLRFSGVLGAAQRLFGG